MSTAKCSLPRRVVDLGVAEEFRPRLYVSKGAKAPYIALSHCWRINLTYKTEQATFSERCLEIDYDALPKTFRDAIQITPHLGLRYLWIDSLCIVQDNR
jgi:Heterokaryon incompatibility protein (HET)